MPNTIAPGLYKIKGKIVRVDQVKDGEVYLVCWDEDAPKYSLGVPARVKIEECEEDFKTAEFIPWAGKIDLDKLDLENIKECFWRDKLSLKIYWNDESYDINGPYDTLEEAERDCETYCREVLGHGVK